MLNTCINAFPLWVLLASVVALIYPPLFTWFSGPLITFGLAIIMLGMGLSLQSDDFRRIARAPVDVLIGVAAQYTVMPLLGFALGYAFDLPTPYAVGLVLVACCPGGTASNVIVYLARGDVALSVSLTAVSTALAAVMTPLLTTLLSGNRVEINPFGLFMGTVNVVLMPVAGGLLLQRFAPRVSVRLQRVAPLFAVFSITLIVASIIGAGKDAIVRSGLRLGMAVVVLHAGGFVLGFFLSKWLRRSLLVQRTISVEVGMQNSGLGVVLARSNFADPAVAIPSAMSSLCHSLIGSLCAAVWRRSGAAYPPAESSRTARVTSSLPKGLNSRGLDT